MDLSKYTDGFFEVNSTNGFLPKHEPLRVLPDRYIGLQKVIDDMPIKKEDGSDGLLSIEGAIEKSVKDLPNYKELVDKEDDPFMLSALYRAYAFLASAFTLAPAHFGYLKTGKYGKAHNYIPEQIAQPLVSVSDKLNVYPWLDYHYSYSLGNYFKFDKNKGFEWENLGQAVKFSGMDDERGFIMLHVDINQNSPKLIEGILGYLNSNNITEVNNSLSLCLDGMKKVNERRQLMWQASRWKHYNDFRVFIMGIKGNDEIFGDGVVYQGVWDEPQQYRGQTGAQDNIIPTMDIFTGVINYYPKNDLTKYLLDLRSYRPICIQDFLADLKDEMAKDDHNLFKNLIKDNNEQGLYLLLQILDEIYYFRNGHWQFVQKYIMANTVYPKATGGTPIISWIPNQITSVLNIMTEVFDSISNDTSLFSKTEFGEVLEKKKTLLKKQLQLLHGESYDAEEVFSLNKKMDLSDD